MTTRGLSKVFLIVILLITAFFVKNGFSLEPFPNMPITIVNGFAAGGSLDICVRALSKVAEKELGQPIINENRPGAAGVIAKAYVCKLKPDGYTLGVTASSTFIIQPHLRKTPYNPFTDVTEIMAFLVYPYGLSVKADAPWNGFEEAIAYARKNPGKFTYTHTGIGVTQHIFMERLAKKEGVKMTQVPFKTTGEAITAVLGGHADGTIQGSNDVIPHIKAGKLKLLLSFSDKRWIAVPHVPCVLEKGYDFYCLSINSIYGPKGIPEHIRQKLDSAFKKAMEDPSFIDLVKNQLYIEPHYWSGKEYSDLWRSQYDEMGKVIKELGLAEK